ncbi:hypothetical protein QBC35DRAFT_238542 [Podospora australis]|uniref:Uncharacterized protein n=1 Tax=Podospora australis TaxID=1536484 RepID=A0AAN7AIV3_9PEZI|nr:hypothetical protein QBC35DRAFT_238542 [Podospora australis]
MAAAIANELPAYGRTTIDSLSPEDFETASIRSAAPSYTSDAPSYHTVAPHPDPVPPYTPPSSTATGSSSSATSRNQVSSLLGPAPPASSDSARRTGLPPVPSGPLRSTEPSLNQFRIPSWSTISSNPTARHYHNVALRRASNAASNTAQVELRRVMLERIEEEEARNRIRPLEDPYLVGEVAAARARRERLARENGDDILIRENRRWDFFLGQMRNMERSHESTTSRRSFLPRFRHGVLERANRRVLRMGGF